MTMQITNPTQNLTGSVESSYFANSHYSNKFPNPFFDVASTYIPSDIVQIFELCELMYLTTSVYRAASRRVVRYFLTELVLEGESDDEREKYAEFLNDKLKILTVLADIGDDFSVYGNCFLSLYFPFDRFLVCPECKTELKIDLLSYKFDLKTLKFTSKCINDKCNYEGEFKRVDRPNGNQDKVKIIRWNPKRIKLRHNDFSGETDYYLEIDSDFSEKIRQGKDYYINTTQWEIIECIAKSDSNSFPLLHFNKDSIFHLKESTLAGLPIKGWGLPPGLPNFKLAYYIQVLRRYDEAIALDYIIPFRVIFPDTTPMVGGLDAIQTTSMGVFASYMQTLIKKHRSDPTAIHMSPFKIGYEMMGGEERTLSPKESIAVATDELLNASGFPADLYKGTLQLNTFPVALRLFEKSWGQLVDGYNTILEWVIKKISVSYQWGKMDGKLRSVTLADDMERKALSLQAAAGMDISKTTAYRPFGIDFLEEQQKVVDEQKRIQELQSEAVEEQQVAESSGEAPQADQQGPGDLQAQAQEIAYTLVTQTPENMRRGELGKIKQSNPTLHALVVQAMDDIRYEMSRQGQAMIMSQEQNQGAMPPKMGSIKLDNIEYGANALPSPLRMSLLIADQILTYNRQDLRKIAMDIKRKVKGADKAFHYLYNKISGG